jgi:hypothetical protein
VLMGLALIAITLAPAAARWTWQGHGMKMWGRVLGPYDAPWGVSPYRGRSKPQSFLDDGRSLHLGLFEVNVYRDEPY